MKQWRIAVLLLLAAAAHADEPKNILFFYALGIGIDGQASVPPLSADIDMSAAEVLEHLEFAAMGSYRWQSDVWSFQADAMFASLAGEQDLAQGLARASVDLDQLMIEADGGYQFHDNLELVFGLRYWDFENTITLHGTGPADADFTSKGGKSFVDPLIGLRVVAPLGRNWNFIARGDVGGFGVGSDFSWQATAFFDWTFARNFRLAFGYRVFDVQFDDGGDSGLRELDLMESGPGVGIAYVF